MDRIDYSGNDMIDYDRHTKRGSLVLLFVADIRRKIKEQTVNMAVCDRTEDL